MAIEVLNEYLYNDLLLPTATPCLLEERIELEVPYSADNIDHGRQQ